MLRTLEAQKRQNKDAIAAQRAKVGDLQSRLGGVQRQIAAIDGTIANGGCAV